MTRFNESDEGPDQFTLTLCESCAAKWQAHDADDDDPLWYDGWCATCTPHVNEEKRRLTEAGDPWLGKDGD